MQTALNPEHAKTKPCPFCGAGPEFMRYKAKEGRIFDGIGVLKEDYDNVGSLVCYFCKATGPESQNATHAFLTWNRRD